MTHPEAPNTGLLFLRIVYHFVGFFKKYSGMFTAIIVRFRNLPGLFPFMTSVQEWYGIDPLPAHHHDGSPERYCPATVAETVSQAREGSR